MTDPEVALFSLSSLFDKITRLPSVPKLYIELMSLMDNSESSIEAIGNVIAQDMAMTAMILKTVNSAPFGLQCYVANATEAASYLGTNRIRVLALSLGIFSQFKAAGCEELYIDAIWKHSIKVATTARMIAKLEGLPEKKADEAFATGLLHDIGKLVLADNFPGPFQTVLTLVEKESELQAKAEKTIFGANHADVGGGILLNWKLPLTIGIAVYLHHDPSRTGHHVFSSLTAVHVADAIEYDLEHNEDSKYTLVDRDYLKQIGFLERLPVWREVILSGAN